MIYIKMCLLLAMLFFHICDDYYLQGWLASAKQKSWWEKNAPDDLYSKDYLMALNEHAFSWTFMIMLIPMIYTYLYPNKFGIFTIFLFFVCNFTIHSFVDNQKANVKSINLIQDQTIHIAQVVITWMALILPR